MSEYPDSVAEILTLRANEEDVGKRADAFISEMTELSRSAAARLIENGSALCNASRIAKNYKVRLSDTFEVELPAPEDCDATPEDIPLDVLFEDEDIIVVNKPRARKPVSCTRTTFLHKAEQTSSVTVLVWDIVKKMVR